MAVHKLGDTPSGNNSESSPLANPRAWVDLGRVVYGWTDVRESDVDRAWWKQAFDPAMTRAHVTECQKVGGIQPLLHDLDIPRLVFTDSKPLSNMAQFSTSDQALPTSKALIPTGSRLR